MIRIHEVSMEVLCSMDSIFLRHGIVEETEIPGVLQRVKGVRKKQVTTVALDMIGQIRSRLVEEGFSSKLAGLQAGRDSYFFLRLSKWGDVIGPILQEFLLSLVDELEDWPAQDVTFYYQTLRELSLRPDTFPRMEEMAEVDRKEFFPTTQTTREAQNVIRKEKKVEKKDQELKEIAGLDISFEGFLEVSHNLLNN